MAPTWPPETRTSVRSADDTRSSAAVALCSGTMWSWAKATTATGWRIASSRAGSPLMVKLPAASRFSR